ncbi:MAG TPA: hypothetical protein VK934_05945, partial [Fimbriimonas sp.]|nr:hypothetical protein [Fimbriimonas sp.]
MRRTVLIVPGLVQEPGGESVLRQKLPTLQALSDLGNTFRLSPLPNVETPEALYLGMPPTEGQLRQGPLTVAALGADPPERSTHFHLSLLSLDEDRVVKPTHMPTPEEGRILFERAKLLNTRTLTVLQGEELDHALVWEGLGDFETHAPGTELSYAKHRPEGDAEVLLRRLIDDSVNLLSDLELNQRRIDEGLQPFNILWPWGHGRRVPVRNLALMRAEPAMVESASLRMAGLSRLVGYSHVDRASVGRGLRTRFSQIAARCRQRDLSIVVMDVEGLTLEEKDWFV